MQKFIRLYVTETDETQGYRLVNCDNILQIVQATTATVTITYAGIAAADVLTITHDAIAANAVTMRDWVADQIEDALRTSWQKPYYTADSTLPDDAAGTAAVTITEIGLA